MRDKGQVLERRNSTSESAVAYPSATCLFVFAFIKVKINPISGHKSKLGAMGVERRNSTRDSAVAYPICLESSDTRVYEPQTRARLGTTALVHQPSQVEQIDGFNTPSFETCNWT